MKKKFLILLQIIILIFTISTITFANDAGSREDPFVLKSYVDKKIDEMIKYINKTLTENTQDNQNNDEPEPIKVPKYTPVLVEVGQTIYGKEGTEMILRSGKGKAVVSSKEGIANITSGKDVLNGQAIQKNNLLIIPRDDKRGVKVTEKAWFLIKGDYEIAK